MDINAAEIAIVDEIKGIGAACKAFPRDPSSYVFADPSLVHLVRYQGAVAAEPAANRKGVIVQDTRHEFVVASIWRHLTGQGGMYVHLDALRDALVGFTIPDVPQATVLYLVRRNFLAENQGVWTYESVFAMSCPESEA